MINKSRCLSTVFILASVILITASVAAGAQDWRGQGRVVGKVSAPDGTPIAGCTVKLTHQSYQDGPTVETDEKGKWVANGLRGGMWLIDFLHPDYEPYGISVQISNVRRGKPIDVVLQPAVNTAGGVSEKLAEEVQAAEDLFSSGDYSGALQAFTALSEESPDVVALRVRIAECNFNLQKFDEAKKIAEEILAQAPDNAAALTVLGNIGFKTEDWEAAQKYFGRVSELAPGDPGIWANLARSYVYMQKYPEALAAFDKSISLNPGFFDLYVEMAAVAMVAENYEKALETLEKLKELAPADHPVFSVWNVDELIAQCKAELGK